MSSAAPHPLQSRTPGVVLGALIGAAIVGALVAVLLLAGVLRSGAVSQAGRTEGPGHSTPEDAVAAYMEGLAQADLEVMLEPFAFDSREERIDREAMIRNLKVYPPAGWLPDGEEPFGASVNAEALRGLAVSGIRSQVLAVLHPDLDQSRLIPIEDDADLAEVIDTHSIDEQKLAAAGKYTLVDPEDLVEPERWDRLRETDEEYRTTVSHEDELRYLVAETSIDGRTWQLIFVTARYDDRWYLNDLGGRLAILLDRGIPYGSGALLVK